MTRCGVNTTCSLLETYILCRDYCALGVPQRVIISPALEFFSQHGTEDLEFCYTQPLHNRFHKALGHDTDRLFLAQRVGVSNGGVVRLRMYGNSKICRYGPGCCGPYQDIHILFLTYILKEVGNVVRQFKVDKD